MSHYAFSFKGETLRALPSGALFWPAQNLLCVSDLHFGKAQRYALQGGGALPPYEVHDTLMRLDHDITTQAATKVVCLGDSFDRLGASVDLEPVARDWIIRLQAGRKWIWIEGNHDPGPVDLGGTHLAEYSCDNLVFRHIALGEAAQSGEISGHYHPKLTLNLKGRSLTRKCFAIDQGRLIMPAFGTYTGGLSVRSEPLTTLLSTHAIAVLTGDSALPVPINAR
ncbi:ligase-associated DNA damage response endonuclease PdeM [Planktotalea sp.]|uniref:ligase-associated DNA damage response endonuclease PdeM n=1 Tax=Planktotalea sp. TaxID=2029877 RepID=UPI0035C80A81